MTKNFREISAALRKGKRNLANVCQEVCFSCLTMSIQALKELVLSIFFSMKTHKDGVPSTDIVSEKDFWQCKVARLLHRNLNRLTIYDQSLTEYPTELLDALHGLDQRGCVAFPLYVQDLY